MYGDNKRGPEHSNAYIPIRDLEAKTLKMQISDRPSVGLQGSKLILTDDLRNESFTNPFLKDCQDTIFSAITQALADHADDPLIIRYTTRPHDHTLTIAKQCLALSPYVSSEEIHHYITKELCQVLANDYDIVTKKSGGRFFSQHQNTQYYLLQTPKIVDDNDYAPQTIIRSLLVRLDIRNR